jgi:hypothetical protein
MVFIVLSIVVSAKFGAKIVPIRAISALCLIAGTYGCNFRPAISLTGKICRFFAIFCHWWLILPVYSGSKSIEKGKGKEEIKIREKGKRKEKKG